MAGSSGAEALQGASVLQNVQSQAEGNSPKSHLTPFQEKLLEIVKGSFVGNTAETGLSEAIQKLDLLHQATPTSADKVAVSALLDSLQKTNVQELSHPENRSAWLARLFMPQAPPLQLDPAYSFKAGENPFAAKPISSDMGTKMGNKDQSKDSGASTREKENPSESSFWNRIKKLLGG